jgi:hypothetical protein
MPNEATPVCVNACAAKDAEDRLRQIVVDSDGHVVCTHRHDWVTALGLLVAVGIGWLIGQLQRV